MWCGFRRGLHWTSVYGAPHIQVSCIWPAQHIGLASGLSLLRVATIWHHRPRWSMTYNSTTFSQMSFKYHWPAYTVKASCLSAYLSTIHSLHAFGLVQLMLVLIEPGMCMLPCEGVVLSSCRNRGWGGTQKFCSQRLTTTDQWEKTH